MADPLTQFADDNVHVTLSGKMMSGGEQWQTGFYVGFAQGAAATPSQAYVDKVRDLWITFFTSANNGVSSAYTFEEVKAVKLNVLGKYAENEPVISHPATVIVGGSAGNPLPAQCALVATLIGGSGKGLAGKGRMYLPGIKHPVNGAGRIEPAANQLIANQLAIFFNALYAFADKPGIPINASRGHKNQAGLSARNVPINGVRVGDVYDTQRRRRNAISENYAVSGLIGP
jgi:hypothetical protein